MMDLVTLVTLCSLGVDPKLMHALVWQQSGGEPWSFIVPGEREPRVYRKLRDAVREVRLLDNDGPIRVGLTGFATNTTAVTETTFLPCPNIAAAAHKINQLTARCEANPGSKADPTFCAIAAYHGSWERPDTTFARAVRATFAKNDAPNFDMPKETGIEIRDALLDTPAASQTRPPRGRNTRPKATNALGRVHCFRQSQSVPKTPQTLRPPTPRLQRNRSCRISKTLNIPLRTRLPMACLCAARL